MSRIASSGQNVEQPGGIVVTGKPRVFRRALGSIFLLHNRSFCDTENDDSFLFITRQLILEMAWNLLNRIHMK